MRDVAQIRIFLDGVKLDYQDKGYLVHVLVEIQQYAAWVTPGPNVYITVEELVDLLCDYQRKHLWSLPETING